MLSPALAERFGPLTDPAQMLPVPWVSGPDPSWQMWLAAAGVSDAPLEHTEVIAAGEAAAPRLAQLLADLVEVL